ncbi:Indoleamine 2,3-dioxygenase 2 [Liparis tanakae]|uniref:Indoleamine 2,3-dioxygenase 2 n=1 Tax=Liparis tanakae TaxID=230148 RepID=A0A4Z2IX50_9TELE|nr:Indoleamine 2,3-dioxygenase 2 [Liparis tanakae]
MARASISWVSMLGPSGVPPPCRSQKAPTTKSTRQQHCRVRVGAFLTRMRDYMPPAHRQQIETLSVCPSLRDFILSNSSSNLCQAYNACVSALVDLRNYHLNTVTKYIIVPGNRARAVGCPLRGLGTELNGTGTSGSSFMVFLKSVPSKKFSIPTLDLRVFDDSKTEVDEEVFDFLMKKQNLDGERVGWGVDMWVGGYVKERKKKEEEEEDREEGGVVCKLLGKVQSR